MDPKELSAYGALILAVIAIFGHLKSYFSSGEKALNKQLSELKTEVDAHELKLIDHDRRTQAIEGELKHLPTKDQVNDLKLALSELGGAVNTMKETVGSVQRTVHRIDDWLREESKV